MFLKVFSRPWNSPPWWTTMSISRLPSIANNFEDDLAIITDTENGFGYRVDDHGNTSGTASNLIAGGATRHYKIRVGDYYRGAMTKLFFGADDDAHSSANSKFKNIKVYESGSSIPSSLNFGSYTLAAYEGGSTGTAALQDANTTLNLTGDIWKAIAFNYSVTPNTILEFDFESTKEGEVHAIGFDTHLVASADWGFQVFAPRYGGWPRSVSPFCLGTVTNLTHIKRASLKPQQTSMFSKL